MQIKREIETKNAKYDLNGLNEEQFRFIINSLRRQCEYQMHCIPDETTPLGELMEKLQKMEDSSNKNSKRTPICYFFICRGIKQRTSRN